MTGKGAQPGARRINRGKGHSYTLDGKPVQGVTSIIGKSMPKDGLPGWAAREVAEFVVLRRNILLELSDEEIVDLCKGAPFRERDAAANRGTEVHRLAVALAKGEEVVVPEELVGHVDSYVAFLDTFAPTDALLERPVFNRKYRYAGTFDLLAAIANLCERGLFDIKTNRTGVYGENALQLAAYGMADIYVDENGEEQPMPEVDFYGVIWVRADGFDLYKYDVTDLERKQFLYSAQTAWWVDNRRDVVRGDAIWQRQEVRA